MNDSASLTSSKIREAALKRKLSLLRLKQSREMKEIKIAIIASSFVISKRRMQSLLTG